MDKTRGMLYGLALGDALGAPHERSSIPYTGLLDKPIVNHSRWQGQRISALGQITDDTEMSLVAAQSLLTHGHTFVIDYIGWANSKIPFLGKNTRALFYGVTTLKGYEKRYLKVFSVPSDEWTQSNGSLMRASPLFVLPDSDIIKDCKYTNPHPINVEANLVYCHALQRLYRNMNAYDVFTAAVEECTLPILRERLLAIADGKSIDFSQKKGWVLHAFGLAFSTLLSTDDYATQIDRICTIPRSDADTNGAIAGAMLGMRFGAQKMLSNEKTHLNVEILMACDTTKGDYPRPQQYSVQRIEEIALGLAERTA
jgi:ADP-ribosyl-[dinitrogen reductase] hydrolase